MKIAILVRQHTLDRCTGSGCLKAFFSRCDAFRGYDQQTELVAFTHHGGDPQHKLERLKQLGVEVIHLSSCLRAKDPDYAALAQRLAQDFAVIGYTHGSAQGRTRAAICLPRQLD